MAFEYVKEEDIPQRFEEAKKFMLPLFEPFDEYERISRNRPHPGIDKSMPRVTDGTLAALIQEQPKRVIQQIPTGKVKAHENPQLEIITSYILEHEIIPNSDSVASLIQKCWALISKSLTYGSQPVFVQFVNRGEYFGTDFTLPYIRDVLLEPGKLSDRDSNVIFLRSYYQPNQIDAIIAKEKMLGESASKRGEEYETGWDLGALAELKDTLAQKDAQNQTPNEKLGKLNSKGVIEIVHVFQRGIGATFYSYAPRLKKVVRKRVNKDPRGMIPIHYMYSNVDLSNPLGRGAVEISGGMQNLLDSEVQSYQYMRALLMNPPLEVRGDVSSATIKYAPNALWKLGNNPNNSVTPVKLETASLQQFPQNYGLIKSQILNLNSSTDTSVSSESGNPGFSKTQAGVHAQESRLGISDKYIRNQFESLWQEVIETEINLYYAERSGVQDLQLDPETASKIRDLEPAPKVDPQTGQPQPTQSIVSPDNKVRIDYDTETPKLKFVADPTSSSAADDAEQATLLKELLTETSADPLIAWRLSQEGYQFKSGEAYKQMFERMGIRDIQKIIVENPQGAQPNQPMPVFDKPKVTIAFDDLPAGAQIKALANAGIDVTPEDMQQPNMNQQVQIQSKTPPPEAPQEQNHPVIRMMEQLDIKFTDLPASAQTQVLQQLGITVDPNEIQQNADHAMAVDQAQLALDQAKQNDTHTIASSNAAATVARLAHDQNQAQLTQSNADRTHEFQVKQANKPVGAK